MGMESRSQCVIATANWSQIIQSAKGVHQKIHYDIGPNSDATTITPIATPTAAAAAARNIK